MKDVKTLTRHYRIHHPIKRAKTFVGITALISRQVAAGKTDQAVFDTCRRKYPGCTRAWTFNVADRKRRKFASVK